MTVNESAPNTSWTLPPMRAISVIENEWISLTDGTRLAVRLWIPENALRAPVPAVLEYIPYRKRDLTRFLDDAWGAQFARYGFAYARVDIRGTGDSDGILLDEYLPQEQADAAQVIAWLARPPRSNGSVGMRGISWGGFSTLQTAATAPPALKAALAFCCSDNRFTDDAHYIGGALGFCNFSWGNAFQNVMIGPPDPAIAGDRWNEMWLARLHSARPVLANWLMHQRADAFWQHGSADVDYSRIKCPVYLVGGLVDSYNNAIPRLLENLNVPRRAIIGPWAHTYPQFGAPGPGLDWVFEEVRWWDHWLNGRDTGIMREPMLRVFMPEDTSAQTFPMDTPGRWIGEAKWPSPAISHFDLALNSDGLSPDPSKRDDVGYRANVLVGLCTREWLPGAMAEDLPSEQNPDDVNSFTLDSNPLEHELEILGNPGAALRLSSDSPIAQVAVRLTEVDPGGRSWLISYGLLNLTHRDGHEDPQPLAPGRFYDVNVRLNFVAHRFAKGSRIRLAISESLWPLVWPSPEPVTLTIATGDSTLTLPRRTVPENEPSMPIPLIRDSHSSARAAPPTVTVSGPDRDGRIAIRRQSDNRRVIRDTETAIVSRIDWNRELIPGSPNSSRWHGTYAVSYKREPWEAAVAASFELTSTAGHFHLTESIRASQGDKIIFEQTWENNIPRDLI
ncbi:MAG: CocE/NonD family hydrolase [Candidatus Binataceae bacterium]